MDILNALSVNPQQALLSRENGILNASKFKKYTLIDRATKIKVPRIYQTDFSSSVNYLDLEQSENRYLLSACNDGSIYIHDTHNFTGQADYTCELVTRFEDRSRKPVECATWFPQENSLIVSCVDGAVCLYDANTCNDIDRMSAAGKINHHQCSPHSRSEIAVGSALVEVMDLRTGNASHRLRGAKVPCMAVAWALRESRILAAGDIDGQVNIWDVRSAANPISKLSAAKNSKNGGAHTSSVVGLAFAPDGLHLLSLGSDQRLRLWDYYRNKLLPVNYGRIRIKSHRHVQFAVDDFVFVPSVGSVHHFDIRTGETLDILHGHLDKVNCLVYDNVYQTLYSGGKDRSVLIWQPEVITNSDTTDKCMDNWSDDEND